eukprot:CAMPEP_0180234174 /NCGR_PEP_ID=MMETSP0987-20121128/28507_1 /TAXON_ID=697907 /ORGANISM="non described non described, Strain CCMP2293" /LENGTH=231 /DNA_ID=CAMNT_0022200119 /DNA_START=18 /DNA_END=714 /DNA_ORIENTATION=+
MRKLTDRARRWEKLTEKMRKLTDRARRWEKLTEKMRKLTDEKRRARRGCGPAPRPREPLNRGLPLFSGALVAPAESRPPRRRSLPPRPSRSSPLHRAREDRLEYSRRLENLLERSKLREVFSNIRALVDFAGGCIRTGPAPKSRFSPPEILSTFGVFVDLCLKRSLVSFQDLQQLAHLLQEERLLLAARDLDTPDLPLQPPRNHPPRDHGQGGWVMPGRGPWPCQDVLRAA